MMGGHGMMGGAGGGQHMGGGHMGRGGGSGMMQRGPDGQVHCMAGAQAPAKPDQPSAPK
jgi:hypothetical protein